MSSVTPPGTAQPTLTSQKWLASGARALAMTELSIARRRVPPGAIGRASSRAAVLLGLTPAISFTSVQTV